MTTEITPEAASDTGEDISFFNDFADDAGTAEDHGEFAEEVAPVADIPAWQPMPRYHATAQRFPLGIVFGNLSILAGLGLTAVASMERAPAILTQLAEAGFAPVFVVLGCVTFATCVILRHIAEHQDRTDYTRVLVETQFQNQERLDALVDFVASAQDATIDRPPASGEELDRVLSVMQRQEEKINNLTRAIKMYGKPLVEISQQTADVGEELAQTKTMVQTMSATVLEQVAASLDSVKMDDSSLTTMQTALESRLDTNTNKLSANIEKLLAASNGEGDEEVEGMVRHIQAELAGVATTLSGIKSAIGRGGGISAGSAPSATQSHSAPAASAPAASKGKAKGGLAHSISGKKKAGGKNVLGAIAKLKQMRT